MRPPEGTTFRTSSDGRYDHENVYASVPSDYPLRPAAVWGVISFVCLAVCLLAFASPIPWLGFILIFPILCSLGVCTTEYGRSKPTVYKIGPAWEADRLVPLLNGPMRSLVEEMLWDIAMEREHWRKSGLLNSNASDTAKQDWINIIDMLDEANTNKTEAAERRDYYKLMLESHQEADQIGELDP